MKHRSLLWVYCVIECTAECSTNNDVLNVRVWQMLGLEVLMCAHHLWSVITMILNHNFTTKSILSFSLCWLRWSSHCTFITCEQHIIMTAITTNIGAGLIMEKKLRHNCFAIFFYFFLCFLKKGLGNEMAHSQRTYTKWRKIRPTVHCKMAHL